MCLRGVAAARGCWWAEAIARICPLDKPWPWSEKSQAIAVRKVAGLTDNADVLRRLSDVCEEYAARTWNALVAEAMMQAG